MNRLFRRIQTTILQNLSVSFRRDAASDTIVRDLDTIRFQVGQLIKSFEGEIRTTAGQVARFTVGQQKKVFGLAVNPNVEPFIHEFIERNTRLITSLSNRQIESIARIVQRASVAGERVEPLTREIESTFNVTRSKANLLARDQTLKLNSNITQATHRQLGVNEYIWTTANDERVREEHEALEGQRFSWDSPPSVGHPGEDYQCRCVPFPVIPELDADLLAAFL